MSGGASGITDDECPNCQWQTFDGIRCCCGYESENAALRDHDRAAVERIHELLDQITALRQQLAEAMGRAERRSDMQFRKKPVVIDAVHYVDEDSFDECVLFIGTDNLDDATSQDEGYIGIVTLEGVMAAREGDWIIRGIKGEVYPCKPDIFEATYEPVEEKKK